MKRYLWTLVIPLLLVMGVAAPHFARNLMSITGTIIHPLSPTADFSVGSVALDGPFSVDESLGVSVFRGAGDGDTLTSTKGGSQTGGALVLTQSSSNNGVALTITNSGTGNDITADNWSVTKSGIPTFTGLACVGCIDNVDMALLTCLDVLVGNGDQLTTAGATDDFIGFHGLADGAGDSTTETNVDTYLSPIAAVVNNLHCKIATAPSANDTWVFTVRAGAPGSQTDTAVTCTITGASDVFCTDAGNAAGIILGSTVTVKVDSSTGAADPVASGVFTCALCIGQ